VRGVNSPLLRAALADEFEEWGQKKLDGARYDLARLVGTRQNIMEVAGRLNHLGISAPALTDPMTRLNEADKRETQAAIRALFQPDHPDLQALLKAGRLRTWYPLIQIECGAWIERRIAQCAGKVSLLEALQQEVEEDVQLMLTLPGGPGISSIIAEQWRARSSRTKVVEPAKPWQRQTVKDILREEDLIDADDSEAAEAVCLTVWNLLKVNLSNEKRTEAIRQAIPALKNEDRGRIRHLVIDLLRQLENPDLLDDFRYVLRREKQEGIRVQRHVPEAVRRVYEGVRDAVDERLPSTDTKDPLVIFAPSMVDLQGVSDKLLAGDACPGIVFVCFDRKSFRLELLNRIHRQEAALSLLPKPDSKILDRLRIIQDRLASGKISFLQADLGMLLSDAMIARLQHIIHEAGSLEEAKVLLRAFYRETAQSTRLPEASVQKRLPKKSAYAASISLLSSFMPNLEVAIERQLTRKFIEKGDLDPMTPLPRDESEAAYVFAEASDPEAITVSAKSSQRWTPYAADLVRFLAMVYKSHMKMLGELVPDSGSFYVDVRLGKVNWPPDRFRPGLNLQEMEERQRFDYTNWRSFWAWPLLDLMRQLQGWQALSMDTWYIHQKDKTAIWGANGLIQMSGPLRTYLKAVPWFAKEDNISASGEIRPPVLPTVQSYRSAREEIMKEVRGVIDRYELRPPDAARIRHLEMREQILTEHLAKAPPGRPVTLLITRPSDLYGIPPALLFSADYPNVTIIAPKTKGVEAVLAVLRKSWSPPEVGIGLPTLKNPAMHEPTKFFDIIGLDLFRAKPDIYAMLLDIADHAASVAEAEAQYAELFSQYGDPALRLADPTFPEEWPIHKAGMVISLDVMPTIIAFLFLALEYRLRRRLGAAEKDLPTALEHSRWIPLKSALGLSGSMEFLGDAEPFLTQIVNAHLFHVLQTLVQDDGWLVATAPRGRYSSQPGFTDSHDAESRIQIDHNFTSPWTAWADVLSPFDLLQKIYQKKKGDGDIRFEGYFLKLLEFPNLRDLVEVAGMKALRSMLGDDPLLREARSAFPQVSLREAA
jgi:hypothetical protein